MNQERHLRILTRGIYRRLRSTLKGHHLWPGAEIGTHTTSIADDGPIFLRKKTNLADLAVLSTKFGGEISIGERCDIHRGALLLSYWGRIQIGNECSVNPYWVLYGHGGLKIGNRVRIAAHSVTIPANHRFDDGTLPIRKQPLTRKGIVTEDDVWIGAGARILDGVVIHKGTVIGSGAVVTKNVPRFTKNAGVPSRIIGNHKTADLHFTDPQTA